MISTINFYLWLIIASIILIKLLSSDNWNNLNFLTIWFDVIHTVDIRYVCWTQDTCMVSHKSVLCASCILKTKQVSVYEKDHAVHIELSLIIYKTYRNQTLPCQNRCCTEHNKMLQVYVLLPSDGVWVDWNTSAIVFIPIWSHTYDNRKNIIST